MKEIKCPHCQKVFSVDESEYAELLNQVKTSAFDDELARRLAEMRRTQQAEQKAALAELQSRNQQELAAKDALIEGMKQKLAQSDAALTTQVELAVARKEHELANAFAAQERKLTSQISQHTSTITELNARIAQNDADKRIALMEAQQSAREEIIKLRNEAELNEQKSRNEVLTLHEQYKAQITQNEERHLREMQMKDEVIAQYRDFKAKQSTKMIGESLEVYCSNQFEMTVRPYLPTAQFCKDNDVVDGTKGDFVFRDVVDGIESVSIMFEMKNEADDTLVKHKNADFFRKLDADRHKKKCEYAVLVSLLEMDNDLYNSGIFSVPDYDKMYVVRPQQFLTIIALLVQTGRNTVDVKRELAEARNRDIDVTNFESKLNRFKDLFDGHLHDAAKRYNDALADIDKAISQLQNMKENLRLWLEHMYKADKNLDDITVRKLTYNNPTMKAKFDEAHHVASSGPAVITE